MIRYTGALVAAAVLAAVLARPAAADGMAAGWAPEAPRLSAPRPSARRLGRAHGPAWSGPRGPRLAYGHLAPPLPDDLGGGAMLVVLKEPYLGRGLIYNTPPSLDWASRGGYGHGGRPVVRAMY